MARTITSAPESALLPAAVVDFLKRRTSELVGIVLCLAAGAIIAALATYSATDPSLNNATDQPVRNILGPLGAIVADIGLQSLGIAIGLPALAFLAWGSRLIRKHPLHHSVARLIMLVAAMLFVAVAVSILSVPGNWPLVTGLGGFTGHALFDLMAPIAAAIAQTLGTSVDPFLMGVAIGASCAFLTPIGHQSNTLVMGPAGYHFGDYWRMGLPLEVLIVIVSIPLILWIWPLGLQGQ